MAVILGNAFGIGMQHRIGYVLSRKVQGSESGWLLKKLKSWGLSDERIAVMKEHMRRRGTALILVNRFLPSIRAVVFLAAGVSGLSFKSTMFWGVLGSLAWSAFILGIGAWVGGNAERMLTLLKHYQTAVSWTVVGMAIVIWFLYKIYKKR